MMSAAGEQIAAIARGWIGTPFVWGQAQKHRGCDCKGLVAGVAREAGRPEADSVYGALTTYRPDRPVPVDLLKEGLRALFAEVPPGSPYEAGDVLLLVHHGRAQHLAIVSSGTCGEGACSRSSSSPCGYAIHAQLKPKPIVKETRLHALLGQCRVESAWRWKEL
jgi:cell wall-associated NlpC family hydrolase